MQRRPSSLTLGIHDRAVYSRMGQERRYSGPRVAYTLLRVGEKPTDEDIRIFEDICFTLRLSNGTWRTTFRDRFNDVDEASLRVMKEAFAPNTPLRIEDRAVSSALTSAQWAKRIFEAFPRAEFEASDLLTQLLEVPIRAGESYVTEPDGTPIQYISPHFVVGLAHPESWRNPLLRLVAARARSRFGRPDGNVGAQPISCVHPEAQVLARVNPNFRIRTRSVFELTSPACDVIRTMNILNRSYFSQDELMKAARLLHASLQPDGIWIVGKTREDDFSNHATIFRRKESAWEIVARTGSGSEMEEIALSIRFGA